jgi:hypothetical protein
MGGNKMYKYRLITVLLFIGFSISFLVPQAVSETKVKLSFDHFYDHAELTKALKTLEKAYPEFMKVISLGKTYQGRDIWGVILNNQKTGPQEHKSGYYIDGNIHGNEIQGTEVTLYAIWYLLTNYGKTDLATRLLDERAFYCIPTMNPDSRDHYINKVSDPNSPRTGLFPRDDDRDGEMDEDGPEDLDGDGSITQMRKKDPNGNLKAHPDDPRIMIPVRPGEKGEYRILGQEGIDNDGDGRINEDPLGGYDMNRNYGFNWQPEYVQMGSGDYPFCWPETKATRDFILAHPNILGGQNFHNTGGVILAGPGANNLGDYPAADKRVLEYVGKQGEKMLPGYRYIVIYKDFYTVYGGSVDFLFSVCGIYTFSNELDMTPTFDLAFMREQEEEPSEEMRRWQMLSRRLNEMTYHDLVLLGEQYSDWKSYKHPLYGDIEIGGTKKFGSRVPPFFQLADTCHRNAAFCLYHADNLPRLKFNFVKVKKLEKNLHQVDVMIENKNVTPTISALAVQKKLHRTDKLKIEGKNTKLLAAGVLVDEFQGTTTKLKPYKNFVWIARGIPGFGKITYRLLVKGSGDINLVYDSLKGGYYTKAVTLK